ncbi:MAG: ABC transporter permease subunit [Spirochaetota bacterium]
MELYKELRRSLLLAVWFVVLTFPIMVIRVNTITDTIVWRWDRLVLIAVGSFFGSLAWNYFQHRKMMRARPAAAPAGASWASPVTTADSVAPVASADGIPGSAPLSTPVRPESWWDKLLARVGLSRATFRQRKVALPLGLLALGLAIAYPLVTSLYQTNIMISALIYVMLALGLNIVIGLGGMLHLGYAAFYLVGAYTYALLNFNFGVGFWVALPIGGVVSMVFGILLAIPVLRLRGDYLAIVTLGFGEIMRIIALNWSSLTLGPSGIKGVDRPGLFGIDLNLFQATNYTYFIVLGLVVITIFIVSRLENSRIGRQWVAMGEDDVAARAMGVNTVRAKMTAFAMGALWAGLAGVVFAARTTFINPESFRVWESVLILSMVVLGGMGSIPGVIVGALLLILLPEYLRAFSEYRLMIFGALLVIMMVFKPAGLIPKRRRLHKLRPEDLANSTAGEAGSPSTGGEV